MREIKFRGMKANGEWVVGYYLVHIPTDEHKIHYLSKILGMSTAIVDKKTVGQFTGLLDKNGKEIFEGDVLIREDKWIAEVVRRVTEDSSGFNLKYKTRGWPGFSGFFQLDTLEIIGNIYENPELIK